VLKVQSVMPPGFDFTQALWADDSFSLHAAVFRGGGASDSG
jgi:hypothetical protein